MSANIIIKVKYKDRGSNNGTLILKIQMSPDIMLYIKYFESHQVSHQMFGLSIDDLLA